MRGLRIGLSFRRHETPERKNHFITRNHTRFTPLPCVINRSRQAKADPKYRAFELKLFYRYVFFTLLFDLSNLRGVKFHRDKRQNLRVFE